MTSKDCSKQVLHDGDSFTTGSAPDSDLLMYSTLQLPQHECWILDTAQRRPCNDNGVQSENGPTLGTALHDVLRVASGLISVLESLPQTALT